MKVIKSEIFWLFLSALVVGILFIAPPLALKYHIEKSGDEFVLAQIKTYRDEIYSYLPRAREVYDGHFPPGELSTIKGAGSTPLNALPPLIFAAFIFLFGGNITAGYLAAQFVFGAIIFLLLYSIGRLLFHSPPWAILFALTATLTPFLTNVFNFDFKNDLKVLFDFTAKQFVPFVRTQIDRIRLSRIDEPLLTYPIYLWAIAAFFNFWSRPRTRWAIFAAIPAGLLAYTYAHHWIYWTIFLGLMFSYAVFTLKQSPERFRKYLLLFAVLAIILVPYFINYFQFKSLPGAEDAGWRFTVFSGRELGIGSRVLLDYITYAALAVLVWLAYIKFPRQDNSLGSVFLGLLGAIVVARNIQLVLGETITPAKWDNAVAPALFIIVFSILYDLSQRIEVRWPITKRWIMIGLLVLAGLVTTKYTANAVSIWLRPQPILFDYYQFPQDVVDSWRWINQNLPPEPGVITPSNVSSLYLMTYTSARPFMPRGVLSVVPNYEIEERFLVANKLFGVNERTLRGSLEATNDSGCEGYECFPDTSNNLNGGMFYLYVGWFEKRSLGDFLNEREAPVEHKIKELVGRYKEIGVNWQDVEADYVYEGPWERQLTGGRPLQVNAALEPIYQNPTVTIYRIKH